MSASRSASTFPTAVRCATYWDELLTNSSGAELSFLSLTKLCAFQSTIRSGLGSGGATPPPPAPGPEVEAEAPPAPEEDVEAVRPSWPHAADASERAAPSPSRPKEGLE